MSTTSRTRTLVTAPTEDEQQNSVLARRQSRLNELGVEGWTLATTFILGAAIVDTLVVIEQTAVVQTPAAATPGAYRDETPY